LDRKKRSAFCAPSARQIDDKAQQEDKADPSSADGGPTDVKAAAAEQKEKDKDKKKYIHGCRVALHCFHDYGALTCFSR
jgi:hypothetical protein